MRVSESVSQPLSDGTSVSNLNGSSLFYYNSCHVFNAVHLWLLMPYLLLLRVRGLHHDPAWIVHRHVPWHGLVYSALHSLAYIPDASFVDDPVPPSTPPRTKVLVA